MHFIPQIFYDLIARVIPSSILIILTVLAFTSPIEIVDYFEQLIAGKDIGKMFSFWGLSSILIIAYTVGFVLERPAKGVNRFLKRVFKKSKIKIGTRYYQKKYLKKMLKMLKDIGVDKNIKSDTKVENLNNVQGIIQNILNADNRIKNDKRNENAKGFNENELIRVLNALDEEKTAKYKSEEGWDLGKIQNIPDAHVMHDLVRIWSPSEGYRLLKLRAEARFCEVLFFGFMLLTGIHIYFLIMHLLENSDPFFLNYHIFFISSLLISGWIIYLRGNSFENYFKRGVLKIWFYYIVSGKTDPPIIK